MYAPMFPSPTIPNSISASRFRFRNLYAIGREIPPQLRGILKMYRAHAQLLRAFQIQFAVVDEQTFFGLALLRCGLKLSQMIAMRTYGG